MPVRESLCLFWRESHTKGLHARFPTRPEEDEGKKVPESRKGDSQEKTEQTIRQKRTGKSAEESMC